LAQILADGVTGDADQPLHGELSQREFQIFCKLAAGAAVSKIADELHLSVKTISTYRTGVLEDGHEVERGFDLLRDQERPDRRLLSTTCLFQSTCTEMSDKRRQNAGRLDDMVLVACPRNAIRRMYSDIL
jgi:hypothetical protein